MTALKTFVSTALLGLLLALAAAMPAAASEHDCWKDVIKDWYDGRIDNVYPIPCYQQAIQNLPEDVQTYSDAKEEIMRALYAAIHTDRGDRSGGGGGTNGGSGGILGGGQSASGEPPQGPVSNLIDAIGPSNAEAVPLPLLILAIVAMLLLGAAAASFLVKRYQMRRPAGDPAPARAPARPTPDQP